MNFGFDIDGTITAAPEAFKAIMNALINDGHRVHVITGTMDAEATSDHLKARKEQLWALGIDRWDALKIVTAPHAINKAKYCTENQICFMFENEPTYTAEIKRVCPCVLMES